MAWCVLAILASMHGAHGVVCESSHQHHAFHHTVFHCPWCVCVWATCEWVVARQNTTCDEPWLTTGLWCGSTLATITITMCLLVWLPCWSTACVCVMAKAWWLVLHFVVAWWPCGCPVCVCCCCWLVALGVWVWLNSGTWLWCCTLCHHVASLGDCCLSTVIVVVLVTRLFGQPFPHHLLCPHPPLSFLLHPRLSLSLCVCGA